MFKLNFVFTTAPKASSMSARASRSASRSSRSASRLQHDPDDFENMSPVSPHGVDEEGEEGEVEDDGLEDLGAVLGLLTRLVRAQGHNGSSLQAACTSRPSLTLCP